MDASLARARVRARRCAVQALYQWQFVNQEPGEILKEFVADRELIKVDMEYFELLLRAVPEHIEELQEDLAGVLDRPLEQVDPVERTVLLIGAYELRFQPDVPWRVAVNESVELVKMFGAEQGFRYVNAALDRLAKSLRPEALA
jgi:N utilization substance protein B